MENDYDFYIRTNLDKYVDQWVAICDNKIISHGKSVGKVFEEAEKKCPSKKSLITRVPDKTAMIF